MEIFFTIPVIIFLGKMITLSSRVFAFSTNSVYGDWRNNPSPSTKPSKSIKPVDSKEEDVNEDKENFEKKLDELEKRRSEVMKDLERIEGELDALSKVFKK